jgi:peptidoglycan/xylan/chitin deacetylase (PgdA/CDA1 family)
MRYFASHFQVLGLEQWVDHVLQGIPLAADSVIITFDDGYYDNYRVAWPILAKYGVPATFFLSTGYLGTGRVKWEDRLAYLVKRSTATTWRVNSGQTNASSHFDLQDERSRQRTLYRLAHLLGALPEAERDSLLGELEAQAHVALTGRERERLMLSWEDVREMAAQPGICLGAHTVGHPHLARLAMPEMAYEIAESKRQLENVLQRAVRFFSYPYGDGPDYDQRSVALVRASGFDGAVTSLYGRNDAQADLFQLRRVSATDQSGPAFVTGLRLRSSGLGNLLKRGLTRWQELVY